MKRRSWTIISILTLICVTHFIINWIWLSEGLCLYGKDVAGHLKVQTTIYHRLLATLRADRAPFALLSGLVSLLREKPLPFLGGAWTWPKLFYIYTVSTNLLFGLNPLVTILANVPVLALLVVSVYSIGAALGDRKTGLLAAFLVSFYPAVFGLSRKYGLDFPLAAMVAFSIALLLRTRNFNDGKKSVLLGITAGLGILVKGQIVLFLAGPFAVSLAASFVKEKSGQIRRLRNFALMGGIALLVSAVWWWGIARDLLGGYFGHVESELALPLNLAFPAFSFGWWTFYLFYFVIDISPLLFLFFIMALPVFLFSRINYKWTLLAWIVVPYVIWTATFQKSYLYFFPSYPAFALITVLGIARLKCRRVRSFIIVVLVVSALLQFWQFSFAGVRLIDLPVKKLVNPDGHYTVYHPPVKNNYREVLQGFIEEIEREVGDTRYLRIGLLELESSIWQENTSDTFDYYMRLKDPDFSLYRSHFTRQSFVVNCRSFAYLIVMSRGGIGEAIETTRRYYLANPGRRSLVERVWGVSSFEEALRSYGEYEVVSESVLEPDGIRIILCRKRPVYISRGATFSAVDFFAGKIVLHPPFVTSDRSMEYPLTVEDSDMLFPLKVPLEGEGPDFVEYAISVPEAVSFALQLEYEAPEETVLSVLLNEVPVLTEVSIPATAKEGYSWWRVCGIGSISLNAGESTIRIEGENIPRMKSIGLSQTWSRRISGKMTSHPVCHSRASSSVTTGRNK